MNQTRPCVPAESRSRLSRLLAWPTVAASSSEVAIIVGPGGSLTPSYLAWGRAAAAEADGDTRTERRGGARARPGLPSSYSGSLAPATEDGFGLTPLSGHGNSTTRLNGEKGILDDVRCVSPRLFTPRATWSRAKAAMTGASVVVYISRLAYASGNSEDGKPAPNLATARRRVANYAAGFLAAGAAAVIADWHYSSAHYVRAIFTTSATLSLVWRAAPSARGTVVNVTPVRGHGYTGMVRRETWQGASGYFRSIVGHPAMGTVSTRADLPVATPPPPAAPKPPVNLPKPNPPTSRAPARPSSTGRRSTPTPTRRSRSAA